MRKHKRREGRHEPDHGIELRAINIKERITIFQTLDLIGARLFHGHTTQQIICPFHDDTKPSARAYENTNKMFCFTCHKLWDPITMVMDGRRLDFLQAIELIEETFKLSSPLENLPLTIRYKLEKRTDSSETAMHLYTYVESRLIETRQELGLERYAKLLISLDLSLHYLQSKRTTMEEFESTMKIILGKINQT